MFDHFVGLTLNGLKLETYLGICQTSKIVIPFVSVSYSIQMEHEKKSMEKKAREKKNHGKLALRVARRNKIDYI